MLKNIKKIIVDKNNKHKIAEWQVKQILNSFDGCTCISAPIGDFNAYEIVKFFVHRFRKNNNKYMFISDKNIDKINIREEWGKYEW